MSADIPFWTENPNILLQSNYVTELFPIEIMSLNQKLNAITRLVIIMTLFSFIYSKSLTILLVGMLSILFIYFLYSYYKTDKENPADADTTAEVEGFALSAPVADLVKTSAEFKTDMVFQKPNANNPLGNVLVTDYLYNPNKKPAPPAYNEDVRKEILEQAKQMVLNNNKGNDDLTNKLFTDLGDAFIFEQSLRPFYSTASTTIPNDQTTFAEFCYGSMVSCKEGNAFACVKNNATKYNNQ
jgi:Ca2+/Na+ antiporter